MFSSKLITLAAVACMALLPFASIAESARRLDATYTHSMSQPSNTQTSTSAPPPTATNSTMSMPSPCNDMDEWTKKCIKICWRHVTLLWPACKNTPSMNGSEDASDSTCEYARWLCMKGCSGRQHWMMDEKEEHDDGEDEDDNDDGGDERMEALVKSVVKQLDDVHIKTN